MIVKNEQDWAPGAVESVRSIVDEVIILDTGCTDSTIHGLRPFKPKVVQFEWNDSFAAARNASLALAHQPWILVLDADERIAAKDLALVVEASRSRSTHGHQLIQRNYAMELAGLCADGERFDEAICLLSQVVERNPGLRESRLLLSKTYIQANRPELVLAALESASPAGASVECLLGAASLQQYKLDEAQKHLEAALKHDRSLPDAHFERTV